METLSSLRNKKVMLISHFNENLQWAQKYPFKKVVFSKGKKITKLTAKKLNAQIIKSMNFGGNQYDLVRYICENYNKLPDFIITLQGNPFDHCSQKKLDKIINNNQYTSIESYFTKELPCEKERPIINKIKDSFTKVNIDGEYGEINNSWFIKSVNRGVYEKLGFLTCRIEKTDDFLNSIFSDYRRLNVLKFSPGSQYIIEKNQILKYSLNFWNKLKQFIPKAPINGGVEAHILERSLNTIFSGVYNERKIIKLTGNEKNFVDKGYFKKHLKGQLLKTTITLYSKFAFYANRILFRNIRY